MSENLDCQSECLDTFSGSLEEVCEALDAMFGVEKGTAKKDVAGRLEKSLISTHLSDDATWYVKKMSDSCAHLLRVSSLPKLNNQIHRAGWVVLLTSARVFDPEAMKAEGILGTSDIDLASQFLREKIGFSISAGRHGVTAQFTKRREI